MTITHNALDLTVEGPPPQSDLRPSLLTSGGQHWRPANLFALVTGSDIWWWPLKHVRFNKRPVRILLECFLDQICTQGQFNFALAMSNISHNTQLVFKQEVLM